MAASRYTLTRDQQDRLIAYALDHLFTNGHGHPQAPRATPQTRGRKARPPVTAKQRSALSRAMIKRWKDAKKEGRTEL